MAACCCAVAGIAIHAIAATATAARDAAVRFDTFSVIGVTRSVLYRENPQRAAGRHVGKPLIAGEDRVDAAIAAGDGDVLDAVLLPGHRLSFDARAGLEAPQLLAVVGIKGVKLAGQLAGEHDTAGRRQYAREARYITSHFPLGLSGHGIDGLEIAARSVRPGPDIGEVHAEVPFALLEDGWFGLVVAPDIERIGVSKAGLRIV